MVNKTQRNSFLFSLKWFFYLLYIVGVGQDLIKKFYKTDAFHPFEWYHTKQTNPFLTYEGTDTQLKLKEESEDVVGEKDVFSLPSPTLGGSMTKVLLKTTTLSGFINQNIEECSQRGYMVNPRTDLGSVEITLYIKHLTGTAQYQLGGPTCFDSPQGCQGMQYLGILKSNGYARLAKKQWFPSGVDYDDSEVSVSPSITGRWVGLKLCIIILDKDRVRIEQYYDDSDMQNNWRPVNSRFDNNNWGNFARRCGALEGKDGQALGFKMPNIMLLGVIGSSSFQIKKGSIRAIMNTKDDTSIPLPTFGEGSTLRIVADPPVQGPHTDTTDDWDDDP